MNREIKFRFWGRALKPPQFIDLNQWTIFKGSASEALFGSLPTVHKRQKSLNINDLMV
jgi:hypothetical protein